MARKCAEENGISFFEALLLIKESIKEDIEEARIEEERARKEFFLQLSQPGRLAEFITELQRAGVPEDEIDSLLFDGDEEKGKA
jgi:hypothetical protein